MFFKTQVVWRNGEISTKQNKTYIFFCLGKFSNNVPCGSSRYALRNVSHGRRPLDFFLRNPKEVSRDGIAADWNGMNTFLQRILSIWHNVRWNTHPLGPCYTDQPKLYKALTVYFSKVNRQPRALFFILPGLLGLAHGPPMQKNTKWRSRPLS